MKKETKTTKPAVAPVEIEKNTPETPVEKVVSAPVIISVVAPVVEESKAGKVGLMLKNVREQQNKTISEISQELCIRKIYLIAIEESDYNNIPEYPYGIGFIRSYADFLGLNGVEIVKMYKEEAEADLRKNNPYFVAEPQVEATVPSKKYLMISLIAILAVYFAWSMYSNLYNNETTTDVVVAESVVENTDENNQADFPLKVEDFSTQTEATEPKTEPAAIPTVEVIPAVAENNTQVVVKDGSYPIEANKKVEASAAPAAVEAQPVSKTALTLKVKKESWVQVKNDNKLYISKVLQPGEIYVVPADVNLKLSVGKAEGVEVMMNDKVVYTISPTQKMNLSIDEIIAQAKH